MRCTRQHERSLHDCCVIIYKYYFDMRQNNLNFQNRLKAKARWRIMDQRNGAMAYLWNHVILSVLREQPRQVVQGSHYTKLGHHHHRWLVTGWRFLWANWPSPIGCTLWQKCSPCIRHDERNWWHSLLCRILCHENVTELLYVDFFVIHCIYNTEQCLRT